MAYLFMKQSKNQIFVVVLSNSVTRVSQIGVFGLFCDLKRRVVGGGFKMKFLLFLPWGSGNPPKISHFL